MNIFQVSHFLVNFHNTQSCQALGESEGKQWNLQVYRKKLLITVIVVHTVNESHAFIFFLAYIIKGSSMYVGNDFKIKTLQEPIVSKNYKRLS